MLYISPMVKFTATIEKYGEKAHQTGWTVITIPAKMAHKINPGCKKSFRVKGTLDEFEITKVALMPAGGGDFIMPLNAAMRKGIRKQKNDTVKLQLALDEAPILPPSALIECMADEPEALAYFNSLPQGHRNYFTKWIDSAKTDATKAKRIALVIKTMIRKMDFGAMLREERDERKKLFG